MKTLKKTLCLVLALVMVVGVLAVSASATFTDEDQIKNKEAADVMNAIGILNGYTDGSFRPEGTLTRAEGAKIIAYILLTPEVASELGRESTFSDCNDKWFGGIVDYIAAKQIVIGTGNGKFSPNGKLTGYAFGKMLLTAMGKGTYNDASTWKINVLTDAIETGLTKGASGLSWNDPITRDNAVTMALNAMLYSKEGEASEFVVKTAEGIELWHGTDGMTALVYKALDDGNTVSIRKTAGTDSLMSKFGYQKDTETDEFGHTNQVITNGKTGDERVVYSTTTTKANKTYSTAQAIEKILTDVGFKKNDVAEVTVFTNGDEADAVSYTVGSDASKNTKLGGNGTSIEVYRNGNAVKLVVIDTYFDTVASVTNGEVKLTDSGLTKKIAGFEKGEAVLYSKTADGIVSMSKAGSITGKVTAHNNVAPNNYVKVDGVTYELSANNAVKEVGTVPYAYVGPSNNDQTPTMVYFLDNYGFIIAAMTPAEAPASAPSTIDGYVYVLGFRSVLQEGQTTASASNLFDEKTTGDKAVAQAKIMNVYTGEVTVVNRSIVKNTQNKYVYTDINGVATTEAVVTAEDANARLMGYKVMSDGTYYFEDANVQSVNAPQKKNANVTGSDGAVYYATNDTTLYQLEVLVKDGETTYSKTSTKNVYNDEIKNIDGIIVADSKNVISEIIRVQVGAPSVTPKTANVLAQYVGQGETNANGTSVVFLVDGAEKQFILADGADFSALATGTIVKLTTENGKAKTYSEVRPAGTGKIAQIPTGKWVVFEGSETAVDLSSKKVFINGNYVTSFKVGDTVTYYDAVR
jgi:hypothetical protein